MNSCDTVPDDDAPIDRAFARYTALRLGEYERAQRDKVIGCFIEQREYGEISSSEMLKRIETFIALLEAIQ